MKTLSTFAALLIIASVGFTQSAAAQSEEKTTMSPGKPAFGISGGHYRHDPGIAIEFTTRAVFQNHLSLRLRSTKQWLEDYKAIHDQWVSYHTFSVGLVYNGQLFERTRFYAELGMLGIVPNNKFSDGRFVDGLYELNGVEINLFEKKEYAVCLFIGIGPAFIKAHADKIEGAPRYGNGVHFINGLRVYLGK